MKLYRDVVQGSSEWFELRMGKPTASRFSSIITPKTWKRAKEGGDTYLFNLLFERLEGQRLDGGSTAFAARGTAFEGRARAWYAFEFEVDVEVVGFATTDDGRAGSSADGLVGTKGMIEIKILKGGNHLAGVHGRDVAELTQTHGGLWVYEREWVDVVVFNPEMHSIVYRIERDDKKAKILEREIPAFCDRLDFAEELHRGLEDAGEFRRDYEVSLAARLRASLAANEAKDADKEIKKMYGPQIVEDEAGGVAP